MNPITGIISTISISCTLDKAYDVFSKSSGECKKKEIWIEFKKMPQKSPNLMCFFRFGRWIMIHELFRFCFSCNVKIPSNQTALLSVDFHNLFWLIMLQFHLPFTFVTILVVRIDIYNSDRKSIYLNKQSKNLILKNSTNSINLNSKQFKNV